MTRCWYVNLREHPGSWLSGCETRANPESNDLSTFHPCLGARCDPFWRPVTRFRKFLARFGVMWPVLGPPKPFSHHV